MWQMKFDALLLFRCPAKISAAALGALLRAAVSHYVLESGGEFVPHRLGPAALFRQDRGRILYGYGRRSPRGTAP